MELNSSLLNEKFMKAVKASLINASKKDGKEKFRVKLLHYIEDSTTSEDDDAVYDLIENIIFLDPETTSEKTTAYTDQNHLIWLNAPKWKPAGESLKFWEAIYYHECLHQIWDTFGIADKLKKEGVEYDHDVLNIASDCVINEYLENDRKRKLPGGCITPEYLEKKFGVVYDKKVDTQYTLYLKLLSKKDKIAKDPVCQEAINGNIKPKSIEKDNSKTPPPLPSGKHSDDYKKGRIDAIKDVVEKKTVDPLDPNLKPKDTGNDEYDKGYNDCISEIKQGLEEGIKIGEPQNGGESGDLQQIPWDIDNDNTDNDNADNNDGDDSNNSNKSNSQKAQEAADKAQEAADKAQEAANNADDKDKAQEAADKAQEAADKAKEAADKAKQAEKDGNDKEAKEQADKAKAAADEAEEKANSIKSSAQKAQDAADRAKKAAEEAEKSASNSKNDTVGEESKKAAEAAKEAAEEAADAAKSATQAEKNGDSKKAEEYAKKAEDAAKKAEEQANRSKATSSKKSNQSPSKGQGKGPMSTLEGVTDEFLDELRKRAEKTIERARNKVSGPFGQFIKRCKNAASLNKDGLAVKTSRGHASWDEQMISYANAYVKKKVFQKKRQYQQTYSRVKRGSGFIKFGQPIEPGKKVKEEKLTIDVAFYIDRSGSMGDSIYNAFDSCITLGEGLKKLFKKEKVVDNLIFKQYVFDNYITELSYGKKCAATGGGTMDLDELFEAVVEHTKNYMINIIITDGQFNAKLSKIEKIVSDIEGMLIFIINDNQSTVESLAKKYNGKVYFIKANHDFELNK